MREVNTHGAAGGRAWLRPSVCVRAIGTRCRLGVNRQGSEVEIWRESRLGMEGMRTDRDRCAFTKIETHFCKLIIHVYVCLETCDYTKLLSLG